MAEILTESFCERCGTRYTFESPARRSSPLGALETVGRGLRNFVVSPDQSIDEAFAVARAETEQRATAHQLEAFHQTFNFCLSCRQYTCGECWNPVDGRCQSCAPMPEADLVAEAVVEAVASPGAAVFSAPEELSAAESVADAPVVYEAIAIARAAAIPVVEAPVEAPEPEAIVEAEPAAEAEIEPHGEIDVASIVEAEAEIEPHGEIDVASMAEAEPTVGAQPEPEPPPAPSEPGSLPALPPGVSLDDEIAAYDLRMAALAVPPPPPPRIQPIAASATPMMAAAAPVPALTPTARIVPAVVPDLPAASEAALPAAQSTGTCGSCGLALSATARFCRRCGTPQQS